MLSVRLVKYTLLLFISALYSVVGLHICIMFVNVVKRQKLNSDVSVEIASDR